MKRASSDKLQQLQTWIRGVDVAMLTTEDRKGQLRSRPMVVLEDVSDDALWFFSDASSHKIDDIHGHTSVNLSYSSPSTQRYISVTGRARVVADRARMLNLWERKLAQWFPKGPEDPELVLVRIEVQEAEVWQSAAPQVEVELAVSREPRQSHELLTFA